MSTQPDFLFPWALVLLPLAALPLLRRSIDTLAWSSVAWLPRDRAGRAVALLWRTAAMLALAAVIVGLAGPGCSGAQKRITGTGAEILILMDGSGSMYSPVSSAGSNTADAPTAGETKNQMARDAIAAFVAQRVNDRFAFMLFGTHPMLAVPFTREHTVIDAAIDATGVGRGMPDTLLDHGLQSAVELFDERARTSSRAIVLVSDGGARLDDVARERIRTGLSRNGVALYFIYLRSGVYSPDLHARPADSDHSPEAELHRFFLSLPTPYRLYQADSPQQVARAMTDIAHNENAPVSFVERLPRQDGSAWCFATALLCCVLLLSLWLMQKRSLR
ncbi:VWA domain-containing protein [Paraburkholderia sp. LEh10]|uniref:vWA domain-containing protein n=1 Tax=Paraburkholderia sp. LEh10 TaxID=2821353 RepID=UPI001AE2BB46|nr:vWA domain-containing protein [Paraburkholderia sp. LEh10]MBP0595619.1 VWA domain-containing protein [Paraburkholderia sp. LEh10]